MTTATTTAERTARMLRDLAAAERQRAESYDHPLAEKDLAIAEARARLCELEDERREMDARREYHCEVADELERLAGEQTADARPVPAAQAVATAPRPPDPDGDLGGPVDASAARYGYDIAEEPSNGRLPGDERMDAILDGLDAAEDAAVSLVAALETSQPLTTLTDPPSEPTPHRPERSTDTLGMRILGYLGLAHRGDDQYGDDQ